MLVSYNGVIRKSNDAFNGHIVGSPKLERIVIKTSRPLEMLPMMFRSGPLAAREVDIWNSHPPLFKLSIPKPGAETVTAEVAAHRWQHAAG